MLDATYKAQMRFKELQTGYRFDKWIFRIACIVIFLYLGLVIYLEGGFQTKIYVKCDDLEPCENPFYVRPGVVNTIPSRFLDKCTMAWCDDEYLEPGFTFGTKEKKITSELAWWFVVFVLGLAFILNHFWYNKGVKLFEGEDL